jgi:hypothetical protein
VECDEGGATAGAGALDQELAVDGERGFLA